MFASNFYIVAFIMFPLSMVFFGNSLAMLITRAYDKEPRFNLWFGPILTGYFTYLQFSGTIAAIAETSGLHLFLLLLTSANFWGGFVGITAMLIASRTIGRTSVTPATA